jgi:putative transposase
MQYMDMDRTIKLKLEMSEEDKESLKDTVVLFNQVFNEVAKYGFRNRTHSKVSVHHATYKDIRERHPDLNSSHVQGARDVACEALKSVKLKTLPRSSPFSAIRYNKNTIRIVFEHGYASVSSVNGRVKVCFTIPKYYEQYLKWEIRSSNLNYDSRNDLFYLHITLRTESPKPVGNTVLGIDRGIVNVAVCSNNIFFNDSRVKNTRAKYTHLRKELQSKGTKSAKRLLKKMSRKERRFVTDVNHCIAKDIVNMPFDVIALEDLTGIRVQKRKGKNFNRKLNNWGFYQLEQFIRYKAETLGKRAISVDPRFSSQKCSKCGHTYKGNRDGSSYRCRSCGFQIHADLNAARNIAQAGISCLSRLSVNQPNVGMSAVQDTVQ